MCKKAVRGMVQKEAPIANVVLKQATPEEIQEIISTGEVPRRLQFNIMREISRYTHEDATLDKVSKNLVSLVKMTNGG